MLAVGITIRREPIRNGLAPERFAKWSSQSARNCSTAPPNSPCNWPASFLVAQEICTSVRNFSGRSVIPTVTPKRATSSSWCLRTQPLAANFRQIYIELVLATLDGIREGRAPNRLVLAAGGCKPPLLG